MLIRVVAPHFVAGLEITNGKCTNAAPILGWAVGKDEDYLRAYFRTKKWKASIIDTREIVREVFSD